MKDFYRFIKLICVFYVLFISVETSYAQTPSDTLRAATPAGVPAAYTDTIINFIRTRKPNLPTSDSAFVIASTRTVAEISQITEYFDGLGRPIQSVSKASSPAGKDLVSTVIYDAFGREQFKYLPYVQQSGNISDGKFKKDPFNGQANFYNNRTLNPGVLGDTIYYSKNEFEASPMNRILNTYAPGDSWAKNDLTTVERGGDRPIRKEYQINRTSDSVRIWNMPTEGVYPTSTAIYASGQLIKIVTTDEHGAKLVEYRDKDNQIILKKVQLAASPGSAHVGWLCTYYVYDDFNHLRFVIPPLAVEKTIGTWSMASIATGLCFLYQYDQSGRVIEKRTPGAGSIYMVYDVRDRLVFMQDSAQRAKTPTREWTVNFHDGHNRVVTTAIYPTNSTREQLQTMMDGISGATANPLPSIAGYQALAYTYYDDYTYAGAKSFLTLDTTKLPRVSAQYPEPMLASAMVKGLVTGTKMLVDGTSQWLLTTYKYDSKGRIIQSISDNLKLGEDVFSTRYDFSGKALSTYLLHKNPACITIPQTRVLTKNTYDAFGRITEIRVQLNDNAALERIVSKREYNELGMLSVRKIGSANDGTSYLDQLSYEYTIRGWLRSINKGFLLTPNGTTNWFGQELSYDHGYTISQYNGNIAGVRWKSRTDNYIRSYGFRYDLQNRLLSAEFTQQDNPASYSGTWSKSIMDFSVSHIGYDGNGNILRLKQSGQKGGSKVVVDQLRYEYEANSNRLKYVRDTANDVASLLGDFKESVANNSANAASGTADYAYDGNGNIVFDDNKSIKSISYNNLNLPGKILINGKGIIEYFYDATGNKLRKKVTDSTVTPVRIRTTDYIGNFVYEQDTLQFLSNSEGRIRPVYKAGQSIRYYYDYFEKDHLGNIRLVLTEQPDSAFYLASMETEVAAAENALFSNIEESRTKRPIGYPEENKTVSGNEFVAKLNGNDINRRIGPSIVLRVMFGDTITIGAKAFYKSQEANSEQPKLMPIESIAEAVLRVFGGVERGAGKGVVMQGNETPFNEFFWQNDYRRLREKEQNDELRENRPKAYLNFVLFDDQFKMVDENSGIKQVGANPDEVQMLSTDKMVIQKSGFLYIYTSNETPQDVYFDEVMVLSLPGPVLEATHYYPFGLTMQGISEKAIYNPQNKFEFNGIEKITDLKLDVYDARFRELDPQIGRWWQVDPRPTESMSPYLSMNNNPLRFSDPLGDTIIVNRRGYIIRRSGDDNLVFLRRGRRLQSIGELGKTINAGKIFKNLLNANIREAGNIFLPGTYKTLVRNRGEWDLKNNMRTIYGVANHFQGGKTKFSFEGQEYSAQDLGNFHYGATGKSVWLFGEETLLKQAGRAQIAAGTSRPEWQRFESVKYNGELGQRFTMGKEIPPYGDDPQDQRMINQGFRYYDRNKENLTEED